jgi:hypothetical protein
VNLSCSWGPVGVYGLCTVCVRFVYGFQISSRAVFAGFLTWCARVCVRFVYGLCTVCVRVVYGLLLCVHPEFGLNIKLQEGV